MYVMKTYLAGQTKEIEKTYSWTEGKNKKREKKSNATSDNVKKFNEKLAEDKLRRLFNANFGYGDLHIILTYEKNKRINTSEARRELKNFMSRLRRKFKKQGKVFKYIMVTGWKDKDGTDGENLIHNETAIHHHLVVNQRDYTIFQEEWERFGRIFVFPLDNRGDYTELANYFFEHTKNIFRNEDSPNKLRYSNSRNLLHPVAVKETVKAESWRKEPIAHKGYFIDKDSIRYGVSEITGYPYQFYRMIMIKPPSKSKKNRIQTQKIIATLQCRKVVYLVLQIKQNGGC